MKWSALLFVSALDVVLAIGLAAFDNRPDKAYMFVLTLAFLWVLPAIIGLWTLVKFWISYHLFLKRRLVRLFKAELHKNNFPSAASHFDAMSYLSSVMDEEDVDLKVKLKAAYFVGELKTYKSERPMSLGFAAELAFHQAMDEYNAPRSSSPYFKAA